MAERKEYLEQLKAWKDEQVIKVVTGIRRCGKSTLLSQYQQQLKTTGITDEQIVSVNFEELEYEELLDYRKLYSYLKERLCAEKTTYIFLDEIQKVPFFEKVVDSLYVKPNVDIYIIGSNAYMLSGDLATLLTGRYVEIKMLPLSFREFLCITGMDAERGLAEYLRDGGLPYIAVMDRTAGKVEIYLEGIYNTVIVKDIEDRQARKESNPDKRKITDILPRRQYDLGFSLENIVYFELLRRGYRVMIGKVGSTEVDFVAEKQGVYVYFQVTADMTAQETFERELRPLTLIRDNYEKIVLTNDRLTLGNYNGIQVKNLTDWLLHI